MKNIRIGQGVDIHQLEDGREFWLGGLKIPHHKGAVGHSDADVLLHAISDALLGAAGLNDIGHHFPDTDPQWKGADSKILLKHVAHLIKEQGWEIGNVDASLVLEQPKIARFIPEMREIIAGILNMGLDAVSIKATTNEKMGYVGRQEGVLAFAVTLIWK